MIDAAKLFIQTLCIDAPRKFIYAVSDFVRYDTALFLGRKILVEKNVIFRAIYSGPFSELPGVASKRSRRSALRPRAIEFLTD